LRYKIECKSLLLQKALEIFLDEYLDEDGIVISDEEGDIIIGKDIKKPFSKSQLLIQLEAFNQKHKLTKNIDDKLEIDMSIFDDLMLQEKKNNQVSNFDEKLDNLINEFSYKLKQLIKEEYGKE